MTKNVNSPSSSRTLSPIVTLVSEFEYCRTMILVSSMPSLHAPCQLLKLRVNSTRSAPIRHLLGQLRMAVAREQLDRVGRHLFGIALL